MLERGGQAVKQLKTSVTTTDHALSRTGLMQANALQATIAAAIQLIGESARQTQESNAEEEEGILPPALMELTDPVELGPAILAFLRARTLWASPLARATQTAMVVLKPLAFENAVVTDSQPLPIELKRHARERRELTSLTTSIGNRYRLCSCCTAQ